MITSTQHEKSEWARMAQAAYAANDNFTGHRYSAAAALPNDARLQDAVYDTLMLNYRLWLVRGAAAAYLKQDARFDDLTEECAAAKRALTEAIVA